MTIYYLRSGDGSNASDGLTWADAKADLDEATNGALATAAGAGDTIYVSDNHTQTFTGTSPMVLLTSGTAAGPTNVITVDDNGNPEPPTALIGAGSYSSVITSGTRAIQLAGRGYWYGVLFDIGQTSTGTCHMTIGRTTEPFAIVLDACQIKFSTTGGSSRCYIGSGAASSATDDCMITIKNSSFYLSSTSQRLQLGYGHIVLDNCSFAAGSSVPGNAFEILGNASINAIIKNCDLSAVTGYLVNVAQPSTGTIRFVNCKLGANVAVTTGTHPGQGGIKVILENCDSDDTNYRMAYVDYAGSTVHEPTKVRTGGASDGTKTISWNMTSSAGASFFYPLESPVFSIWNESTGSALTATVEILHDNVTNITDAEVWLEVVYLGTSGVPIGSTATDRVSTVLATAEAQTDSSETWTTTGLTNPNTQKLVVTFTPREKGYVQCRVMLAKASYTVYVDPKITVA